MCTFFVDDGHYNWSVCDRFWECNCLPYLQDRFKFLPFPIFDKYIDIFKEVFREGWQCYDYFMACQNDVDPDFEEVLDQ